MSRDVWKEINSRKPRIRRPFGAALSPDKNGEIIVPALITEPTRRITRRDLRAILDGEKA